jgi:hypothetical protein
MNLKEAKEQLEKNGYKIQKLNECGSSGCGGGSDDYSTVSTTARKSRYSTLEKHPYSLLTALCNIYDKFDALSNDNKHKVLRKCLNFLDNDDLLDFEKWLNTL